MNDEQICAAFTRFAVFLRMQNADPRAIVEYSLTMAAGVGFACKMDSGEMIRLLHQRLDHNAEMTDPNRTDG